MELTSCFLKVISVILSVISVYVYIPIIHSIRQSGKWYGRCGWSGNEKKKKSNKKQQQKIKKENSLERQSFTSLV